MNEPAKFIAMAAFLPAVAFCLMINHVRFLVPYGERAAGQAMRAQRGWRSLLPSVALGTSRLALAPAPLKPQAIFGPAASSPCPSSRWRVSPRRGGAAALLQGTLPARLPLQLRPQAKSVPQPAAPIRRLHRADCAMGDGRLAPHQHPHRCVGVWVWVWVVVGVLPGLRCATHLKCGSLCQHRASPTPLLSLQASAWIWRPRPWCCLSPRAAPPSTECRWGGGTAGAFRGTGRFGRPAWLMHTRLLCLV